jgi:hypothetical protein
LADDVIAAIEKKRAQSPPSTPSGLAEQKYDAAYKKAAEEKKQEKPTPTGAEIDTAGKEAGREAVRDGYKNGDIKSDIGESFGDQYRREWEGDKRGTKVPDPDDKLPDKPSNYMKECAKGKVPLPPPWGDPRWVKTQDNLDNNKVLDANATEPAGPDYTPKTEVWTSKSPNGICYALPRIGLDGKIRLLGQICQSDKTGKACFWDNIGLDGKRINPDATAKGVNPALDPAKLQGGDKLGENCTKCHRGDNVFSITPGTPLQRGPRNPCDTDADEFPEDRVTAPAGGQRYEPIGRTSGPEGAFSNPPEADSFRKKGTSACSQCHGIPKLSASYCGIILGMAGRTMPPPDGSGVFLPKKDPSDPDVVDPNSAFAKDYNELRTACRTAKDPK